MKTTLTKLTLGVLSGFVGLCSYGSAPGVLPAGKINLNDAKNALQYSEYRAHSSMAPILRVAEAGTDEAPTYISRVPEGAVSQLYSRDWRGFWVFNYMVSFIMQGEDYNRVQYLWFDGDDVYMQFPVSSFEAPGYIKGHKTETGITFEMPQCVYSFTDYETGEPVRTDYYVQPLYFDTDFFHYYTSDTGVVESFDLTLKEDGTYEWINDQIVTAVDPEDGVEKRFMYRILGITNQDDEWSGYGDFLQVLTPFKEELTEVPEQGETSIMTLSTADTSWKVNTLRNGSDLYVQGLWQVHPEHWAKGRIEGDKLIFDRQYMGLDADKEYFGYLRGAHGEMVWNDILETETLKVTPLETLEFTYDSVNGTYTAEDGLMIGGSLNDETSLEYLEHPLLQEAKATYVPMAPEITKWYEYNPDFGSGSIYFNIFATSLSGKSLDTSRLSWRLDLDWEPYIWKSSKHSNFKEDMEWIPYDYADPKDIYVTGDERMARFREKPTYMVGVTVRYIMEDGKELFSPTAEVHTSAWSADMTPEGYGVGTDPSEGSSVKCLRDSNSPVKEIQYYDLSGRRLRGVPENGLYLEVKVKGDGSRETIKKSGR